MAILWTIVIGFIVGLIARAIMPGDQKLGFIMTTICGIAGALLATWGGQALGWYAVGQTAGWIMSVLGAIVVLWIYGVISKNRKG